MKILDTILLEVFVGLVAGAVGYNSVSVKYPSCELVTNGIGVSTYGCSNTSGPSVAECANEKPNSQEMAACINRNYYRAKYLPFGFTQRFGDKSNLIDPQPRLLNTLAMVIFGFALTLLVLRVWPSLSRRFQSNRKLPPTN